MTLMATEFSVSGGAPVNREDTPVARAVQQCLGQDARTAGLDFTTDSEGRIQSFELLKLAKSGLSETEVELINRLDRLAGRDQSTSSTKKVSYDKAEIEHIRTSL